MLYYVFFFQIFDVQAEHPELFSNLATTVDKMTVEISRGNSPLSQYVLGSLNATRATDTVLLTEIHLVLQMVNAVSIQLY